MGHLAPYFDPDVFVSYSHGDPRAGCLKDWTQGLIEELRSQILDLDPEFKALSIWMDAQIDPTVHLTPELRAKVSASGVLMIVMTKHYLDSSWCKAELEWFQQQIKDRAGDAGRVFVIRAQKTEVNEWPQFLCDEQRHPLIDFTFHDQENGMPLGFPHLQQSDLEFRKELVRLHTALTKRMRELRQRAEQRSRAETPRQAPPVAVGSRRVYLHSPPESEAARADIGRALSCDGIATLTAERDDGPRLADMQRESKLRIEAAKRCEALARLRADDSDRFVGDLIEIGVDERERIETARGAPMPCAVLDKTGEKLPLDVSGYRIDRFDVNRDTWRGEFRRWLDAARASPLGAPA